MVKGNARLRLMCDTVASLDARHWAREARNPRYVHGNASSPGSRSHSAQSDHQAGHKERGTGHGRAPSLTTQ